MISQREARRNRKELERLREQIRLQRSAWSQDYTGGVEIGRGEWSTEHALPVSIRTARKLGHAVVCIGDDTGRVRFVALPHPKEAV